jgi:hypothetical protein
MNPLPAVDMPQYILAFVAAFTAYTAWRLNKRSKTKELELQEDANQLAARVQDHTELKDLNSGLREEIERQRRIHREDLDRCRAELDDERKRSARFHREYLEIRSLVVGQVREEATRTAGEPVALPPMTDEDEEEMGP